MMVVEFLYFGKVFDPLQFQMNEVEVDRLLIGAGVKFGVFTNIWVKYRFQGTFYCPKSSKKCVCTLSTFYSQ